jgi:hypothetical protein
MFIFIFFGSDVVLGPRRSLAVEFNAGERDATFLHHCDHVSRYHNGANRRPIQ